MPTEKRKALTIVYTGNGKGKTTAALGVVLRAWGREMKVVMLSFIKSETSNYGEERAARKLGIELIPLGAGFTWLSKDLAHDRDLAQRCWALCNEKIASGLYDIVILDEITYPINYGWLDIDDVLDVLRNRPPGLHIILTGRDAPQALIDYADLVTEMTEVKHPFQAGIKAQPGIDF
ncbi:MAG: cob(I)yrinic acid a,c-diamide adenosyltransferase [Dehalococcoidia bacterium]|nr:cob(I)yrinic acid a,c-diamide adenosyltransferase [Dehalococcoidia bacterium]